MSKTLDLGLQWLEQAERGHARLPGDLGGDTWYGIARTFHPSEPWPPTKDRARQILTEEYWRFEWEQVPAPVALVLFDAAVNQGVTWAVRTLQHAVGAKSDGQVGPDTLAAIQKSPDPVNAFLAARAEYYAENLYARGLLERLFRLRAFLVTNNVV